MWKSSCIIIKCWWLSLWNLHLSGTGHFCCWCTVETPSSRAHVPCSHCRLCGFLYFLRTCQHFFCFINVSEAGNVAHMRVRTHTHAKLKMSDRQKKETAKDEWVEILVIEKRPETQRMCLIIWASLTVSHMMSAKQKLQPYGTKNYSCGVLEMCLLAWQHTTKSEKGTEIWQKQSLFTWQKKYGADSERCQREVSKTKGRTLISSMK